MSENIAQQLEKRVAYRRAMKRAMQGTMRLGLKVLKFVLAEDLRNDIAEVNG